MFLRKIYRAWCLFWFLLVFLTLYPFFLLFIQRKEWHAYGHFLNKIWAHVVFTLVFLPAKVEKRFKPAKKTPYIYCPNHASYLDIPSLCYGLPGHFLFVGKASLTKVPLFGYMFRRLYIPVDRNRIKSKYDTMIKCYKAIDDKKSIAIFPEGTIPKGNHPNLISFKDGPFRMAIEKQVAIVPVTIAYNWIILPDDNKFIPRRHLMKMVIHEPIETKGMTLEDTELLKQRTFAVIEEELKNSLKRKA
jgi:1-acyl-sn-glycerol-3-phosphate acyltransferase